MYTRVKSVSHDAAVGILVEVSLQIPFVLALTGIPHSGNPRDSPSVGAESM